MADEPTADQTPEHAPAPCGPCRGTGTLISSAGGTPHEVRCPWCEGSGTVIPGHDAQAERRAQAPGEPPVSVEVD